MKIKLKNLNIIKKDGGFTLIELVMTIILIGILSIGLYEVVMWGINDYLINEEYLHSNNSMTYAMTVIRRNLVNAAMPSKLIKPAGVHYCKLFRRINPANPVNPPIVTANMAGQTTACGGRRQPVCDEVAFYQNISGTANQQLVVFCVNNNILYEEVTGGTGTTSYPVADNSLGIVLSKTSLPPPPPPPSPSNCVENNSTGVYSCNINFKITNLAGYYQVGGVSVIVANPQ